MKNIKLTKAEVTGLIEEAQTGLGRETELGGNNFQVDITILRDSIPDHPELAGGTVRVILNKNHRYIGHTVLAPRKKYVLLPPL